MTPLQPASLQGQIDVVAFDLDGTLVESPLDFAAIRHELGWQSNCDLLQTLAAISDHEARAHAAAVISRHEMEAAERSVLLPGVLEALHELHECGFATAILTRNIRVATQHMLSRLKIPISLVLTREDCAAKPDPEGLLRIAAHYQRPIHRLLYIGDYHFDLTTAANAGAQSCLLLTHSNQQYAPQANWLMADYSQLARALTS